MCGCAYSFLHIPYLYLSYVSYTFFYIYQLGSSASSLSWVCDACEANPPPARCKLCPRFGGAYARAAERGQWVHQVCAEWMPGARLTADHRVKSSGIHRSRWSHKCYLCKRKGGCVVACMATKKKCPRFFHPLCALLHADKHTQPFLGVAEDDSTCSYCHLHPPPGYTRDDTGQWMETPLPFNVVAMQELHDSLLKLRTLVVLCRRRSKVKSRVSA